MSEATQIAAGLRAANRTARDLLRTVSQITNTASQLPFPALITSVGAIGGGTGGYLAGALIAGLSPYPLLALGLLLGGFSTAAVSRLPAVLRDRRRNRQIARYEENIRLLNDQIRSLPRGTPKADRDRLYAAVAHQRSCVVVVMTSEDPRPQLPAPPPLLALPAPALAQSTKAP